jgi:hypothetical protein
MGPDHAVIPAWVTPSAQAVADAHRIAHVTGAETGDVAARAVAASINWVTGGQLAPLTERTELPTRELVTAEWLLAGSVEHGTTMVWGSVSPVVPVTLDRRWAAGTSAALGWLLGCTDRPPVRIPRRLPDGSVPTAEQLYDEMLAARPHAAWTPEMRAEARRRAAQAAVTSQRLADLAARA